MYSRSVLKVVHKWLLSDTPIFNVHKHMLDEVSPLTTIDPSPNLSCNNLNSTSNYSLITNERKP